MSKIRQQVGETVQARRVALGMRSQRALAKAANVSVRTVGSLERGEKIGTNSASAIELALKWQPGSLDMIKRGEAPTTVPDESAANPPTAPTSPESSVPDIGIDTSAVAAMLLATFYNEGWDAFRDLHAQYNRELGPDTMRQVQRDFTALRNSGEPPGHQESRDIR